MPREALSQLSADRLVIAEPQKGYSVAPVSSEDLIDLTHARIEIEGLCLTDALAHGDLRWESEILAAFHRLCHLPEKDPRDHERLGDEWSLAHDDFHAALVSACRSQWLLNVRAMLYAQAERYRRLSVPLRRGGRDVDAEHHAILKAVMARDAERGRMLVSEHLEATTRLILDGLTAMKAAQDAAEDNLSAG